MEMRELRWHTAPMWDAHQTVPCREDVLTCSTDQRRGALGKFPAQGSETVSEPESDTCNRLRGGVAIRTWAQDARNCHMTAPRRYGILAGTCSKTYSVSACCSSRIRRPMASQGAVVVSVTSARVSVDGQPEQARSGLAFADVELA